MGPGAGTTASTLRFGEMQPAGAPAALHATSSTRALTKTVARRVVTPCAGCTPTSAATRMMPTAIEPLCAAPATDQVAGRECGMAAMVASIGRAVLQHHREIPEIGRVLCETLDGDQSEH